MLAPALALVLALLLVGCGDLSEKPPEAASAPPEQEDVAEPRVAAVKTAAAGSVPKDEPAEEVSKEYRTVEVFFGTDRNATEMPGPNNQYGTQRSRQGALEYGKTSVSIPRHHQMGVVERPRWYKLEFSEDPKKHVTILELNKLDADSFFASLKEKTAALPMNEGLLFIHGFNVAFDDAIRRTAQIAFDLDFGGAAMSFSWPSQGSLSAYTVDETNAEWAAPHLSRFLLDIQQKTGMRKLHIIAHSMGTRVLSYALKNAVDSGFNLKVNNVVLAAPDIDVDIFKEQILPKISKISESITMYSSSDDAALKVSRSIHGNDRLGLSGNLILVLNGMDTVDASGIDTSMIGHAYYGSHKRVVDDIFGLLVKGLPPVGRNLSKGPAGQWIFGQSSPQPAGN